MAYKDTPLVPLALWFPFVVITGARELGGVALSLGQFPLLATGFALGIRRWPVVRALSVLVLVYALLTGIAVAIVRQR